MICIMNKSEYVKAKHELVRYIIDIIASGLPEPVLQRQACHISGHQFCPVLVFSPTSQIALLSAVIRNQSHIYKCSVV